jgi:alginate O-acetyltransferase complex protein AlgI
VSFVTVEYFFFFPLVLLAYCLLQKWGKRAQNPLLLAASYFFYASWNPMYLTIIFASTALDYILGHAIDSARSQARKQALLVGSLVANFGVLGFFKYFNFFADSFTSLLGSLGLSADPVTLKVLLPVGISFYTFQSMSYTLDIYRGQLKPTRSFLDYATFVAFFPQLVAGPIVRANQFLPQITEDRRVTLGRMGYGAAVFLRGYVKKAFIADVLALDLVDKVFTDPGAYDGTTLLLAVIGYSIQIYGDFSGYTDMARGSAAFLGFELPPNFNYPYLATSLQDFWRRWHISLSSWFRDYVFIPMGGSKQGQARTFRNLVATTTLSGLWHGAAWTFVIWGFLHGILQVVARLWQQATDGRVDKGSRAYRLFGWAATYAAVLSCWVFFRCKTPGEAVGILWGIVSGAEGATLALGGVDLMAFGLFLADHVYGFFYPRSLSFFLRLPAPVRGLAYAAGAAILFLLVPAGQNAFIYFQF